ncbi:hypothetical protein ACFYXC_05065 [Streptomyces sp. NPDC002701]|uniref:hypothetical protein n=1 Tax=Streptomyces sp. NPDC002701 TaxID=3364661 RepID=UPI0036BCB6EF
MTAEVAEMPDRDRVFPSRLLDLSPLSFAELAESDDPALRQALRAVRESANDAFGPLLGDSQSEEMSAYARRQVSSEVSPQP